MSLLWIHTASKTGGDLEDMLYQQPDHKHTPSEDFRDAHQEAAAWLDVEPGQDVHYTLEHHPMSSFPNRGKHDFAPDEHEYIKGMADHLRSGGHLPPGIAVDMPQGSWGGRGKEPVTIIDGNHRAAAHAEAGSKTMPLWVGRAK